MDKRTLNALYRPLHDRCKQIVHALTLHGFEAQIGWYNGHYYKNERGEYEMDYYPIPVITVPGLCDIEIQFDTLTLSAMLTKERALQHDYSLLDSISFEIYGVENYLTDYYLPSMTIAELRANIENSAEKKIGFSFSFALDLPADKLSAFLTFLKNEGFFC